MEITRHFTATTIIVHKNKVLLHFHKKLNIWVPVGGHIDRDELPHIAALREIREESGLDVDLYNPDKRIDMIDAKQLPRPMHVVLVDINNSHQHIDFVYFATSKTNVLYPQNGETTNLKWFNALDTETLDNTPINVKMLCLEALNLLYTDVNHI